MSSEFSWNTPWPGRGVRDRARGARRGHSEGDSGHRRERRGRGGRGRGPWQHGGFGPPGMGGPWGGMPPMPPGAPMPPVPPSGPGMPFGRRGRKARRGDVRAAILALLAEGPMNGYQVMQAIGERSRGGWRPSPGAVYPALQQLTDEELVQPTGEGRRTLYELTDAGMSYVADHPDEVEAPWEAMTPQFDEDVVELMSIAQQTSTALMQVVQSAGPAGRAKARKVLEDGRRQLYQILADGEDSEPRLADGEDSEPRLADGDEKE